MKEELLSMDREMTPARLRSILRLINYGEYTEEELKELICLDRSNTSVNHFNMCYRFLLTNNIISLGSYNRIEINKSSGIKFKNNKLDETSFKELMRNMLFKSENSIFYYINKIIFDKERDLLYITTVEDMASEIKGQYNINENNLYAYRFWSRYLGYSEKIRREFLILNPYEYLKETIKALEKKEYNIKNFMEELEEKDSFFSLLHSKNEFSKAFTIALLELEDDGYINMELTGDARSIWYLSDIDKSRNAKISSIELRDKDDGR